VRRKLLIAAGALVLLLLGLGVAAFLTLRPSETAGTLQTDVTDVSVSVASTEPTRPPKRTTTRRRGGRVPHDKRCWLSFGGDPQRTSSRPNIFLGRPTKHFWVRGLKSYIEFAPAYCDGRLYVNTFRGTTYALNAHNGAVVWKHRNGGLTPSTPAIAGPILLVSSTDGTETGLRRSDGKVLWKLRVRGHIESSPVAIGNTAYFGASDGRLFSIDVRNGRIRWAYQTGGRINSSPSVWGNRVCITTYAGSIFCLDRRSGRHLWHRYIARDAFRNESFYASASTDGRRLFTISRAGTVLALDARNGRVLWKHRLHTWGYSTPAIARGRIYVGDFRGDIHCYRAGDGVELWRTRVGGRVLAPGLIVGNLIYFSNLETKTFGLRTSDGKVVWRIGLGKYQPGIATERHYFFTLNGLVLAYRAENDPAARESRKPRRATAGKRG
jgi:outer membrane protein assembly factor BamB